tara:strand:- start:545 stop:1069 length:525 start_codon:yes stop_codon:yes gene_type:complete
MSNLRLINETTATNVASISATDIFSTDFDIYKVILSVDDGTQPDNIYGRFINSSGSVVTNSSYDWANADLNSYGAFTQQRYVNQTFFYNLLQAEAGTNQGGNAVIYVFNPYSSSSYSYILGQTSQYFNSSNYARSRKYIGILKQTSSITGLNFYTSASGTPDFSIKTYGLRVDS